MVALSKFSTNVNEWPKWQIALGLGATITLAIIYFKYSKRDKPTISVNSNEIITPESDIQNLTSNDYTAPILNDLDRAIALKEKGNVLFKSGKFSEAIEKYSEAISICPVAQKEKLSTFYQNRAAAYDSLKNYPQVIEDCTKALEINKTYIKALNRRAKTYETMNRYNEALEDFTAICITERFQNIVSIQLTDKILKKICLDKAKEVIKTKQPILPSYHFIENYFNSFKFDPVILDVEKFEKEEKPEAVFNELSGYKRALYLLSEKKYEEILSCCTEEIEKKGPFYNEALLLSATFKLLYGKYLEAKAELDQLFEIETVDKNTKINALIKLGAIDVHNEDLESTLMRYEIALTINPNNCDLYRHRAQIYLFLERYKEMLSDVDKCIALYPDIPDVLAQKYFIEYKNGAIYMDSKLKESALKGFEDLHKKYPKCAPAYFLHAQIRGELDEFNQAEIFFKKAFEADPRDGNVITHLGLLMLHYKRNLPEALKLINQAIEIDPKCGLALETLGTIEVQRGNLEKGIKVYEMAIDICRSEPELTHIFSLQEAAKAQLKVATRLDINFGLITSSFEQDGY